MAKFILSKFKVLDQFDKVERLADIVSYSSKTNPFVTRILEKERGCMFSVHAKEELKNIYDKTRILFLAQCWNEKFIDELVKQGIKCFVVDNEPDLNMLLKYLEGNDVKIKLLLRIKLKENTIKTEKFFAFGLDSEIVNKRLRELNMNPKISELGVHFHRKTQNMSEWNLKYEIENMLDSYALDSIKIINIGGGLPSEYANTNVEVMRGIILKIKELRDWLNAKGIKMMIEPGRFIAAPAVKLTTTIIGIHGNNIIVDASVYNADMDALIVPIKLKVEGELDSGKSYVVKGVTPCSLDLFRYKVYLKEPKVGDEIVFLNAGAYNFYTDFCDLVKIETIVIDRF
ncbi:decarboxylase [Candidatus Woesearchaeota archaeon]|nr:decarboxylase [Candidatus Woesearchaeota archaeon]